MTIQELQASVGSLSREELHKFARWFEEFRAERWDRQIEEDARSGRLQEFYERLQQENVGEPDISLDEVLDDEELPTPAARVAEGDPGARP